MVKSSVALLCKSTSNLKKRKIDETPEQFLKQITHLYLNEKHLQEIGPEIRLCRNLTVLYLYGNLLKEIPDLSSATQLTHLYLQNNKIQRMENLTALSRLEKLFLSRNCISIIEGLEGLECLQELRIDNQKLQPEEILLFDEQSLSSISKTLKKLDVSGNRLETLRDLTTLSALTYLCASNNCISDLRELTEDLRSWKYLNEVELNGNPVMNANRAKESIIVNTSSLETLDGKQIPQLTRTFLENWHRQRGTLVDTFEKHLPPIADVHPSFDIPATEQPISISQSIESLPPKQLVGDDFDLAQGEAIETELEEKRVPTKTNAENYVEKNSVNLELERLQLHSMETIGPSDRGETRRLSMFAQRS